MSLTVNSYIEALLNSSNYFKTLSRLYPETDINGMPIFYTTSKTIVFSVTRDDKKWHLTIPIGYTETEKDIIELGCSKTQIGEKFICEARYFRREMLVFDTEGEGLYVDIILQPAHDTIHHFIRKNSNSHNKAPIRKALESVADIAEHFDQREIIHGTLCARNVCVDNKHQICLLDYPLSLIRNIQNDNSAFLTLSILLYIMGCQPNAYRLMNNENYFDSVIFKQNFKNILSAAEFCKLTPLIEALNKVYDTPSRADIIQIVRQLALTSFEDMPILENLIQPKKGSIKIVKTVTEKSSLSDVSLKINFEECDFVGNLCDTLMRYRFDEQWGYTDRLGNKLNVEKKLIDAHDFYEGRAVVRTTKGFALIDRQGIEVMTDEWGDMVWHGKDNIVTACNRQGLWHIYNRSGEQLSTVMCQWMGGCHEGTIVAKQGNKFGYINSDGKPLTEFIYNQAASFDKGKALVEINGNQYYIDHTGRKRYNY